jgi:hypothetical protein
MSNALEQNPYERIPKDKRKLDRKLFIAAFAAMTLHQMVKGAVTASGLPLGPLATYLLDDTGDLPLGYVTSWITDNVFERFGSPNLLRRTRRAISIGVSTANILGGEIPKVNEIFYHVFPTAVAHTMVGTPRLIEIPAGLVGIGIYAAVNIGLNRKRARNSEKI